MGPKGIVISALSGDGDSARGYAWFSADGLDWQQIESLEWGSGAVAAVASNADGFVATVTDSYTPTQTAASAWLWESTDGIAWTQKAHLSRLGLERNPSNVFGMLNGMLVSAAVEGGVWTIEDEPRELIPAWAINGLSEIQIGGLGLVALAAEWDKRSIDVLFSPDGTTWNRWKPEEFGDNIGEDPGTLYVVGVGDDFVTLRLLSQDGHSSFWVGTLP